MFEPTVNYAAVLVTFRDLLDDGVDFEGYSEYVRGGVNLIADLFPRFEVPVDVRMDEVLEDLRRIPQNADYRNLEQFDVCYSIISTRPEN